MNDVETLIFALIISWPAAFLAIISNYIRDIDESPLRTKWKSAVKLAIIGDLIILFLAGMKYLLEIIIK